MSYPAKLPELTNALTINGWDYYVQHGIDTGENPYIHIEAKRTLPHERTDHVMVTWHTRATGTYRLFSCMFNKHDVPLSSIMRAVQS